MDASNLVGRFVRAGATVGTVAAAWVDPGSPGFRSEVYVAIEKRDGTLASFPITALKLLTYKEMTEEINKETR